jgi:hypothetical protein
MALCNTLHIAATCGNQNARSVLTEQTLNRISDSCRDQKDADLVSFVHWSRQLVASIRKITRSELLIGANAVTYKSYNPHFPYFSFQHALAERGPAAAAPQRRGAAAGPAVAVACPGRGRYNRLERH